MTRFEVAEVERDLRAHDVVNAYGLRIARRGRWWRLKECPRCKEKSSRLAIAINPENGAWLHHGKERAAGGECSGDILDLVAALEGLDCRKDFPRVIARAAEIAGLDTTGDPEQRRKAQDEARARVEREANAERLRHDRARKLAGTHWDALRPTNDRGEAYLRSRGLDPDGLRDCAKFTRTGDVVVAIRDVDGRNVGTFEALPDGAPVSTATRRLDPGDGPKVLTLEDCSTRGTMIDCIADIAHGRDVALVEGLADSLTARLAFPGAVILGANGAGMVAKIASVAVPRVKLARSRLLLVPHDDDAGAQSMIKAAQIAIAAGLELGRQLFVVELPAKDLNAAWCAGWRYRPELAL